MFRVVFFLFATFQIHGFDHLLEINGTCEISKQITHFDWDQLFNQINVKPFLNHSFSIDADELKLIIDIDLEYLGWSYADDHTPGYGVSYVLDFEDYNAEGDSIREPGTCQNRLAQNFTSLAYSDLWDYSATPNITGHLGTFPYSAYPPSGPYWSITSDGSCSRVHYHGEFTWYELLDCTDYSGSVTYNTLIQDTDWVNLTGVFYTNIVSPLALNFDLGFYRVYQSLSAPFVIAVAKQVSIISSVGINLFVLTIIAVYKEDFETDWRMILLTESADFLMLNSPNLIADPSVGFNFSMGNETLNPGCLSSGYLCLQLWELYVDNVTCPTNFTGTYTLQYQIGCNPEAIFGNVSALCSQYLEENNSSGVTLSAELQWIDEVCDARVFVVEFEGAVAFFKY
eukprot:1004556_1